MSKEAQKLAEEMVENNKVTPTIGVMQGVNVLGSWTPKDAPMVSFTKQLEKTHKTTFFSFLEPRLWSGGTRRLNTMSITQRLQAPDPVKSKKVKNMKLSTTSSGNFTQLIWRASKTLGVGYGRFVS